jgi:hypothetical protein
MKQLKLESTWFSEMNAIELSSTKEQQAQLTQHPASKPKQSNKCQ